MKLEAVIGFSLCAAALSLTLRQYRPEFSMILSVVCGIGVLLWLAAQISPVLGQIKKLSSMAVLPQEGGILLKSLGICLVTQIACDTCRDIGETAIASRLETAGRAAMLLLAMPMFVKLLEQAATLIG